MTAKPAPPTMYVGDLVPRGLAVGRALRLIASWSRDDCLRYLTERFHLAEHEWSRYHANELRERCMALRAADLLDATPTAMIRRMPK